MKPNLLLLLPLLLAALPLRATTAHEHVCGRGHAWFAPGDASDRRKYAPVREADLLHLALDVTPDFKERSVAATATLRLKPVGRPLAELKLDAVDLRVSAVSATEKVLGWQATEEQVIVTFDPPVPADREATVTIRYSAVPQRGLYFRTPEMGYKPEDTHLWTQGEPNEARHWFPCFDEPNDKFTSEITCRVPGDMVALSNGKRVSEERDAGSGRVAVRWLQDKPHVAYLIALCAGKFKKVEDTYRDIPMAFWTPASQIDQAMNSFKDTKDMMAFFEKEIGVPYPWARYDQVCVNDFGWGGMENTTLTVLNDSTLHTPATENLRDSQGLVAHELAHQWFGDLVTCKDWAHLWLNEGFATYYEALYELHKRGRDDFLLVMHQRARGIAAVANDTNPIVHRDFRQPEEQFGFRAYPKGSWILHMLRSQLGEELYRRCIKTYLERHQFGLVVTEDLNAVIEEVTGRSFDHFFDQYVYHAHHPELTISYSWDERAKLAKLSVQQVQKLSDDVLLFDVPLTVRFKGKSGGVDRELRVRRQAEDFYLPLAEAPEIVRIDPNVALLAKITFTPPNAMIHAQLADKTDAIGRLLAVEHLSGKKDALAKLKDTLNNDPFHAVRVEASKAIRAIQTDEAHAALLASTKQPDARVRRQVVSDITGFYRESTREAVAKHLAEEKNPDIKALAIAALGAYPKPDPREQLLSLLNSDSYRNSLADAAINALRAQDDARYLPPLLDTLAKKEGAFTTGGFARGLDTVAWLARNEEDKTAAREFLVARLNHPRRRVQQSAIAALGTLGDPKAIAALETLTTLPKESPERGAAEKAVAALRDVKKPSAELGSLRGEVLTLQKENRDLRRDFDDLKKKFDALHTRATATAATGETNKNAKPEKPTPAKPKKR
jgi:aminopeptidase N